ncbi:hypothetical protein GT021_00545 [Streptomyces sp. SID5470]|nr:hypothetical protein [Streptomyces sp. SID5470]
MPNGHGSNHCCPAADPPLPPLQEPGVEEWRRRYPLFPRLLFVLDGAVGPRARAPSHLRRNG